VVVIYTVSEDWGSECYKKYSTVPDLGGMEILELNISCQFLHFAETKDIWLKSAVFGKILWQ